MILFLAFVTAGAALQFLNVAFGLWFSEIFIFLGIPVVFIAWSRRPVWEYVRLKHPGWGCLGLGFAVGAVNFIGIAAPIQWLALSLAPAELKERFDGTQLFQNQTPVELAAILLAVGACAPLCEELFFRGVLAQGLFRMRQRALHAVWVSGFIFSAFHLDPVGFLARWELGLLFGYLYLRTGSLWPGIAAHAANNLVSSALFFAGDGGAAEENTLGSAWVLLLMVAGIPAVRALFRQCALRAKTAPLLPTPPPDAAAADAPSLLRIAAPWVAAAALSLAALWVVDRRGLQIGFQELSIRLPPPSSAASPEEKRARESLNEMRRAARGGEIPIPRYIEERRRIARRIADSKGEDAPPAHP
jgi:membrane protease YdiL (CAAX protease family)